MVDRASRYINEFEFNLPTWVEIKYSIPKENEIEVKTLGDLIKKKRIENELTKKNLAKLLRVQQDTIYYWEIKNIRPKPENLEKLINCLKISNSEIEPFLDSIE